MLKILSAAASTLIAGLLAIPVVTGGGDAGSDQCSPGIAGDASMATVLATIRQLESGRYDQPPNAGGASGAYQYIDTTWRPWAERAGIDVARYPNAYLAPPAMQDTVAELNVRAILDDRGDVAAIPVAWYWPRALDHPEELDTVPAPWAGNTLTVRQYQQRWLATFEANRARQTPPSSSTTVEAISAACGMTAGIRADVRPVIEFALAQLGKPYVFGTAGPDTYDCSGLTNAAYATVGVELPHFTGAQVQLGRAVDWHTEPIEPGDLIFIRGGSPPEDYGHVGIALDNQRWINAPHTGDVVRVAPLPSGDRIQALRRYTPVP